MLIQGCAPVSVAVPDVATLSRPTTSMWAYEKSRIYVCMLGSIRHEFAY